MSQPEPITCSAQWPTYDKPFNHGIETSCGHHHVLYRQPMSGGRWDIYVLWSPPCYVSSTREWRLWDGHVLWSPPCSVSSTHEWWAMGRTRLVVTTMFCIVNPWVAAMGRTRLVVTTMFCIVNPWVVGYGTDTSCGHHHVLYRQPMSGGLWDGHVLWSPPCSVSSTREWRAMGHIRLVVTTMFCIVNPWVVGDGTYTSCGHHHVLYRQPMSGGRWDIYVLWSPPCSVSSTHEWWAMGHIRLVVTTMFCIVNPWVVGDGTYTSCGHHHVLYRQPMSGGRWDIYVLWSPPCSVSSTCEWRAMGRTRLVVTTMFCIVNLWVAGDGTDTSCGHHHVLYRQPVSGGRWDGHVLWSPPCSVSSTREWWAMGRTRLVVTTMFCIVNPWVTGIGTDTSCGHHHVLYRQPVSDGHWDGHVLWSPPCSVSSTREWRAMGRTRLVVTTMFCIVNPWVTGDGTDTSCGHHHVLYRQPVSDGHWDGHVLWSPPCSVSSTREWRAMGRTRLVVTTMFCIVNPWVTGDGTDTSCGYHHVLYRQPVSGGWWDQDLSWSPPCSVSSTREWRAMGRTCLVVTTMFCIVNPWVTGDGTDTSCGYHHVLYRQPVSGGRWDGHGLWSPPCYVSSTREWRVMGRSCLVVTTMFCFDLHLTRSRPGQRSVIRSPTAIGHVTGHLQGTTNTALWLVSFIIMLKGPQTGTL